MPQTASENPWAGDLKTAFGFGKPKDEGAAPVEAPDEPVWINPGKLWEGITSGWNNKPLQAKTVSPTATQPTRRAATGLEGVFARVVHQESRGRHTDRSGGLTTSPVGAKGITQVMPKTGKNPGYGVRPLADDSEGEYLRFGKDLLRAYVGEFGGDVAKGVAAYNAGPGRIQKAVAKHGDNWKDHIPAETKDYLNKVLGKK